MGSSGPGEYFWLNSDGVINRTAFPEPYDSRIVCTELDKQLERFGKLEKPPRHSKMSPDDVYCEEYFRRTVRRNSTERYIVSLPVQHQYDSLDCLGSSHLKAYRQFLI